MDSCIMVWDPWRGGRSRLVKQAHSLVRSGRDEAVEITAACFDPPQQLLLTGAANGTLKIWNFNTGICVRNMTIGDSKSVPSLSCRDKMSDLVSTLLVPWRSRGAAH